MITVCYQHTGLLSVEQTTAILSGSLSHQQYHSKSGPEVITFFMLNSAEHENFPAHKCYNANCWHFNIYE